MEKWQTMSFWYPRADWDGLPGACDTGGSILDDWNTICEVSL